MNAPPDHVAATVVLPVNRSRNPITLSPAADGPPSVADHEIVVLVTSSSCCVHGPVIVQIGLGFRASVTSARTVAGEPCITSKNSLVARGPQQPAGVASPPRAATRVASRGGAGGARPAGAWARGAG